MKKRNKNPLIPDETPLEFFKAVKIPEGWRFVGKSYFKTEPCYITYFYEYEFAFRQFIRVDFITPQCRGGLLGIDRTVNPEKKTCICSNMQSYQLNEFIEKWNKQKNE